MDWIESESETEVRSLEMAQIHELFQPEQFPMTTAEMIDAYGHHEISYPRGAETLASILETSGAETYETPDQVMLALLNGVGRDAVGRPRYSDRGAAPEINDELARSQESF